MGAGFDQDLTGRDNILLGGAFLGLDDAVTRALMPAIIEYAELGEFIDAPIKTYSSGMRARLGSAIATSVDPDILLLDEVLATGDAAFRAKSKERVIEIVRAAKAASPSAHDMNWVTEYCNRAILIEKGRVVLEGEPGRGRRDAPGAHGPGASETGRGGRGRRGRSPDRPGTLTMRTQGRPRAVSAVLAGSSSSPACGGTPAPSSPTVGEVPTPSPSASPTPTPVPTATPSPTPPSHRRRRRRLRACWRR